MGEGRGEDPRDGGAPPHESVARRRDIQEHSFQLSPASLRRAPSLPPDVAAVIPHQVDQHDGQEGGEGAPALPTREDPVVLLDKLEQSPGAELLGLMLREAAELAVSGVN